MLASKKKRSSKKPSTIPWLLERPPKPDKAKNVAKRVRKLVFDLGTAYVNPLSTITDPIVGKNSPVNAKNLGGRTLAGIPILKHLVPDEYKPTKKPKYGAGLIGPPEKPKTFRDRMRFRRKPPTR